MGIRTKAIVPSLVISLVACCSIALLGLQTQQEFEKKREQQLAKAANQLQNQVQTFYQTESNTIENLVANTSWQNIIQSTEFTDGMQILLRSTQGSGVDVAAIFDREQNILFTTNKPPAANQFYGASKFIKRLENADSLEEFQGRKALLRKFFVKIDQRTYPIITARFLNEEFYEKLSQIAGLQVTDVEQTPLNKKGGEQSDNEFEYVSKQVTLDNYAHIEVTLTLASYKQSNLFMMLVLANLILLILGVLYYWRQSTIVYRSEKALAEKLQKLSSGLPSESDITEWKLKPVSQLHGTEQAILQFLTHLQKNINQISSKLDKLNIERVRIDSAKKKMAVERDKALQAPKQRAEFFSKMADEITVPLNGVNSMLNLLDEYKLQEEPAKLVTLCRTAANTLIASVNNMMDFYRLDAGNFEIKKRPFEVAAIILELRDIYKPLAHEKGLRFDTKIAADVPATISNDKQRIMQLIDIFINNAIRFTEKGDVGIFVDFQVQGSQKSVRFSIKDSGVGMSKEAAQELLDSLTTRSKISNASFSGRLKLIVAKRIAEALGGQIGVNSEEAVGSRFWFTINI
jgi:two-component system, NarL family, sensor histidine kinase BarA